MLPLVFGLMTHVALWIYSGSMAQVNALIALRTYWRITGVWHSLHCGLTGSLLLSVALDLALIASVGLTGSDSGIMVWLVGGSGVRSDLIVGVWRGLVNCCIALLTIGMASVISRSLL